MFNEQSNIEAFNQCAKYNDLGDCLELEFSEVAPLPGIEKKHLRYLYAFSCFKDEGSIYFDHNFFEIYGIGSVSKEVLREQQLTYEDSNDCYRVDNPAYLMLNQGTGDLKWVVYKSCTEFRKCMLALKDTDDMSKLRSNYVNFWTPAFYERENQKSLDDFMESLFHIHGLKVEEFGEYKELFKNFQPYTTAHTWNNFMINY